MKSSLLTLQREYISNLPENVSGDSNGGAAGEEYTAAESVATAICRDVLLPETNTDRHGAFGSDGFLDLSPIGGSPWHTAEVESRARPVDNISTAPRRRVPGHLYLGWVNVVLPLVP